MTTLTGKLTVALPPHEAWRLFTPRGEKLWAAGWDPRFPLAVDGNVDDDSEPGTVFQTDAHGRTATWLVMDRTPARRIRYARVIPADNAGTVTVELAAAGERSEVTVTYDLVPLSDAGQRHLDAFAAGYADYFMSWQDAIAKLG